MRRCSAFFSRSMARSCWPRYPAYLILILIDLSSLRISDESVTAEHAEFAAELRSKNCGIRFRRTGASCSTVISGRFSNCARDCPTADDRSCGADTPLDRLEQAPVRELSEAARGASWFFSAI